MVEAIALGCGGDVRKSINAVEMCVLSAPVQDGRRSIGMDAVRQVSQRSAMRYDRDGDAHYDILSAFHKSVRGSDENAALHYLARLLVAGDLLSPCRRLLCIACEDIGLAWPQAIPIVKACVDSALQLGLPEARLPLADATILLCTAPKSNAGVLAIDAAMADVKNGRTGDIPAYLKDSHYSGAKNWGGALPTSTRTLTQGTTIRSSTCRTKSETGYTTSFRTTKRNRRRQPIADKFWGFGRKKEKVTAKVAWAGGIFMFGIRQIDKMHQQDILLENEPFPLWGRMIPSYEKENGAIPL